MFSIVSYIIFRALFYTDGISLFINLIDEFVLYSEQDGLLRAAGADAFKHAIDF